MTDFIRRKDVKKEFGICPETLENHGVRRHVPIEGVVYFKRSEIDDWIAGHEFESHKMTKEAVDTIVAAKNRAAKDDPSGLSPEQRARQDKLWEEWDTKILNPRQKSRGSREKGQDAPSKKAVIDESLPSWEKDRIKLKEEQHLAREERKKAKLLK